MKRVLILTDDRLGLMMAGPAIRASEIARHLAKHAAVTLASTQPGQLEVDGVAVTSIGRSWSALRPLAEAHDVILAGGMLLAQYPGLAKLGKHLVLDLYDPFLLEDLELLREHGALGEFLYREHHQKLEWQMQRADFMICASDRQRDYWLGRLCALGRLSPQAYSPDPSFEHLVACVPFGLPGGLPQLSEPRLRGVYPGIGAQDRILLWGGGIWDWLDPLTPIRAMARVAERNPEVKLVFLAGRSPNPTTPEMSMSRRARALADELGLLGRSVIFYEHWVPYAERGSLLLEADAGVTAHFHQLETRFSFRTRVLDYLWAGLPILATGGDSMGDLVAREGLGLTCGYESTEDWERAIMAFASQEALRTECQRRIKEIRPQFTWEQAVAPLVHYLEAPYRTPAGLTPPHWLFREPLTSVVKAGLSLKAEGWEGLRHRIQRRLSRHVPD